MPYQDLDIYQQKAQYFAVDGHRLAYWHSPQAHKPVVLFLHGFPSASWDWHHQWQSLAPDYSLVAMDFLGFGLSDKPHPHTYSLQQQADGVEQLLERLNIRQYTLIAHDYGVSVAQELLARQAQTPGAATMQALCWLNGGLFAESHRPLLTQKLLKSPIGPMLARLLSKRALLRSFTRIFGVDTPPEKADIDALWWLLNQHNGRRVVPSLLSYIDERALYRERWVTSMQHARIPLMFINGVQDPISGRHMLQQYRALIPDPQTHAMEVGHYPQLEAPDDVTALLSDFLLRTAAEQNAV